jgi:Protein of unknown function (DUF3176)
VAVIAILIKFDNKPLGVWKFFLKPNAVISVFSTISKASVLYTMGACISQLKWLHFEKSSQSLSDLQVFDAASRGPLGSLQLLFEIRGRARAASLGALIVVIALAMDPFTQQILAYPSSSVAVGRTGGIPVTDIYKTDQSGNGT